jgi:hypothetical protein
MLVRRKVLSKAGCNKAWHYCGNVLRTGSDFPQFGHKNIYLYLLMDINFEMHTPIFGVQAAINNSLDRLKNCPDIKSLKLELASLCSRFGSIARLDILMARQAGKRQALCFLRMESDAQEQKVMRELGVGRFGGDIVVVIDLQNSGTPPF